MPFYEFQIRKADHPNTDGTFDLHVHILFHEGRGRIMLGKYRLPSLEPLTQNYRELTSREIAALRSWLGQNEQQRKLLNFLKETLFDMDKLAKFVPEFGDVITVEGDTYIDIRIPVSRRIG